MCECSSYRLFRYSWSRSWSRSRLDPAFSTLRHEPLRAAVRKGLSSFGTGVGGFVHVIAAAIGVSALVMASAEAFTGLKIAGAVYLIWLGIKTWQAGILNPIATKATGVGRAFREGIVVEALNPKTGHFSRVCPAIRGPIRQHRPSIHRPWDHLGWA